MTRVHHNESFEEEISGMKPTLGESKEFAELLAAHKTIDVQGHILLVPESKQNPDNPSNTDSENKIRRQDMHTPPLNCSPKELKYNTDKYHDLKIQFFELFHELPRPRLFTFLYMLFEMCHENKGTIQQVADWLGVGWGYVQRTYKKFQL